MNETLAGASSSRREVRLRIRRKSFGTTTVLGPVDLDIAAGSTVAITGPSGIGKSTLLRIVSGLDREFDGDVKTPARISPVFQEPTLLPWLSAMDNLTVVTGVGADEARQAMMTVGLASKESHYPRQLSLGQQRRLSLARAFVSRPELLLMDEPFASLDEQKAAEMMMLTRRLIDESGVTAILVTHSLAEARALGARTLHLSGQPATLSETA